MGKNGQEYQYEKKDGKRAKVANKEDRAKHANVQNDIIKQKGW